MAKKSVFVPKIEQEVIYIVLILPAGGLAGI
jgi:hypothetical protein